MRSLSISFILLFSLTSQANTYIFVSYSMGDEALKSYYKEAQQYGATLVMRGLVDDSFQKTKEKAQELKITYDINPPLFDEYNIKQVPVIASNDHKMTGHVTLKHALEKFKERP